MRARGRHGIAGCLLMVSLGVAGCGEQQSSEIASDPANVAVDDAPSPDVTAGSRADRYTGDGSGSLLEFRGLGEPPVPTSPPTFELPELPELDDTQLQANLAALSAADRSLVDHYLGAPLGEGTWIVAAPMTVEEARLRLLGPEPTPARRRDFRTGESSAYTFLQVGDGVVAWEHWGFSNPPQRLLAELSRDGAASAVVTDNVEAMTRFGYARDGQVVFDAHEYAFVDSIDEIPAEVRDLARLAWEDLEGPMVETADWFAVGMAMAEKVTGVRGDPAVQDVTGREDWYAVPLPWGASEDG